MKLTYDKVADALYISFSSAKVSQTVELGRGLCADLGNEGNILGIELLGASKLIAPIELAKPLEVKML